MTDREPTTPRIGADPRREASARRLDGSVYDSDDAWPHVYELGPDESPSTGVVMAVAAVCGHQTTALEPLYGTVDPDALDRLIDDSAAGSTSITFCYAGTTVTVDSNRTVRVDW